MHAYMRVSPVMLNATSCTSPERPCLGLLPLAFGGGMRDPSALSNQHVVWTSSSLNALVKRAGSKRQLNVFSFFLPLSVGMTFSLQELEAPLMPPAR